MNRDELIYKWLNHELDANELEAFRNLEDYDALSKLNQGLKGFKSSDYNTSNELQSVLKRIELKTTNQKYWLPKAITIAAIFVVCFGIFYFTTTIDTTIKTLASQKQTIGLPDNSTVQLNAMSALKFNKSDWNKLREVTLDGEAYFKVAKGSKFKVITEEGTITVLGTKFNIKQRNNYFEVVCYEGVVNVNNSAYNIDLSAGNSVVIRDGKLIAAEKEKLPIPSWIDNYSQFKSTPYKEVIAEFERQFDVKIELKSIDNTQLFTGSFYHDDIESALKSITLPLQLTYSKTNRTIILKRE
jgi:ferric-dicitrate binding protein FerR (iron transport regulator)